jgi:hypothetical protein
MLEVHNLVFVDPYKETSNAYAFGRKSKSKKEYCFGIQGSIFGILSTYISLIVFFFHN